MSPDKTEALELDAGVEGDPPVPNAEGEPHNSRLPHLGHAMLLLFVTAVLLLLSQLILMSFGRSADASAITRVMHPKRQIASQAIVYLTTIGISFTIFPLLWERGFLAGINWHGGRALRYAARLIPLGVGVGLAVQGLSSLIPMPKSIPMDDFFRTPSDVWLVAIFGTLVAPAFEEIVFRGFLLPAFAIGFDWIDGVIQDGSAKIGAMLAGAEPPKRGGRFREENRGIGDVGMGNLYCRSRAAVIFASVLSSMLFALLHGEQIAHAWGGLAVLFCVSLMLTVVRVRLKSVACSAMVHASYNFSVFATIFVATGGFRHLDRLSS